MSIKGTSASSCRELVKKLMASCKMAARLPEGDGLGVASFPLRQGTGKPCGGKPAGQRRAALVQCLPGGTLCEGLPLLGSVLPLRGRG